MREGLRQEISIPILHIVGEHGDSEVVKQKARYDE